MLLISWKVYKQVTWFVLELPTLLSLLCLMFGGGAPPPMRIYLLLNGESSIVRNELKKVVDKAKRL